MKAYILISYKTILDYYVKNGKPVNTLEKKDMCETQNKIVKLFTD